MALIDEVKTALRVSLNDDDINLQIQSLIDAAKEDLYNTADISKTLFEQEEIPALIKIAINTFVKAFWTTDDEERAKLLVSYDGIKAKLSVSSAYSTYDEE